MSIQIKIEVFIDKKTIINFIYTFKYHNKVSNQIFASLGLK